MKKYRAGKIKREHTVIEGLWPVLEQMARCDLIDSIIPGPIRRLRGKGFELTFQRFTETGLRLLGKNGSAIQEVYAVTSDPEGALKWLGAEGLVELEPAAAPAAAPAQPSGQARVRVQVETEINCDTCGRPIAAGSGAYRMGRKRFFYIHTRCAK